MANQRLISISIIRPRLHFTRDPTPCIGTYLHTVRYVPRHRVQEQGTRFVRWYSVIAHARPCAGMERVPLHNEAPRLDSSRAVLNTQFFPCFGQLGGWPLLPRHLSGVADRRSHPASIWRFNVLLLPRIVSDHSNAFFVPSRLKIDLLHWISWGKPPQHQQ